MRLKELRINRGFLQKDLSEILGVDRTTYSKYESGASEPNHEMLVKLAQVFDVSTDYLLGRDITEIPHSSKGILIPVLGDVAAGIPIEAVTDIVDYEEIDEALSRTGDFFGLRIKGSSMEPRMREGDVVIVRKQDTADSGDTVVVLVNGDSATVKKIKIGSDGIMLISSNPSYDPMFYSTADVEQLPVRVIGRVVELRAKF